MSSASLQKLRETAKRRNFCTGCVSRRPMRGLTKCEICNDASRAGLEALRATAQERGVCVECLSRPVAQRLATRGRNAGLPVQRCEVCLDRNAARVRNKTALAKKRPKTARR